MIKADRDYFKSIGIIKEKPLPKVGRLVWIYGGQEQEVAQGTWPVLQLKKKYLKRYNPNFQKGVLKIKY